MITLLAFHLLTVDEWEPTVYRFLLCPALRCLTYMCLPVIFDGCLFASFLIEPSSFMTSFSSLESQTSALAAYTTDLSCNVVAEYGFVWSLEMTLADACPCSVMFVDQQHRLNSFNASITSCLLYPDLSNVHTFHDVLHCCVGSCFS